MAGKKIKPNQRFMLKGSLRKQGFDRWRLVTCASSVSTGEECTFFIEYYFLNPFISPEECNLGFKSRYGKTAADLQYALAGNPGGSSVPVESYVQPSFVMVKAGVLKTDGGKQINNFIPFNKVHFGKNDCIFYIGSSDKPRVILSDDFTHGQVSLTPHELTEHPEFLCSAGKIEWELRFETKVCFNKDYKSPEISWNCLGSSCLFAGSINLDGEKFIVNPKTSFGYYDKIFGREFVNPFYHLNASNFTSIISGKKLPFSCVAVQGEFKKTLSILTCLEGEKIEFNALKPKTYEVTFECSKMPQDGGEPRLHWSVSVHNKKYVIDIDIFSSTDSVFVRDYECPEGNRRLMKILGGANGNGELRLYKKIHKTLELIEHVRIENAVCEYGNVESAED